MTTEKEISPTNEARAYFLKRYEEVVGLPFDYGKIPNRSCSHLKHMTGFYGIERVRKMIDILLTTRDPWIIQLGRSIPTLYRERTKIAEQTVEPKNEGGGGAPRN